MKRLYITGEMIEIYKEFLVKEEKSCETIQKYIHDIKKFLYYIGDEKITKNVIVSYKKRLINDNYSLRSVNSMIASLNSFFNFVGRNDLKVKAVKLQPLVYCPENKELTKSEYIKLIKTAESKNNMRLSLLMQTICALGIRVSEVEFITIEAVKRSKAVINLKGKIRTVFIINELRKKLLSYAKSRGITSGAIFITRTGKCMSRTNIWREMKKLCDESGINPEKVFPHNLRHLFARTFYEIKKDIAKPADILGHSNINTTRIYIITTGEEHRKCMESMRLII